MNPRSRAVAIAFQRGLINSEELASEEKRLGPGLIAKVYRETGSGMRKFVFVLGILATIAVAFLYGFSF